MADEALPLPTLPAASVKLPVTVTTLLLASMPALGVNAAVQWIWSLLVNGPRLPFCTVTLLLSKVLTASVKVIVTALLSPMATLL